MSGRRRRGASRPSCGGSRYVKLLFNPNANGQSRSSRCPPELLINSSWLQAYHVMHEWMHFDAAYRGFTSFAGFSSAFGDTSPRRCTSDDDCGGAECRTADFELGWFDDGNIRRWDGVKMCIVDARPQGFIDFYALESPEHDAIETAQLFRWSSGALLFEALRDFGAGEPQLWNKVPVAARRVLRRHHLRGRRQQPRPQRGRHRRARVVSAARATATGG
jgi:hypothetical protein